MADSRSEPLVLLRQNMPHGSIVPTATGRAAVLSRRSPDKPTDNEDGALVMNLGPQRSALAVADGLGGQRAGEEAAELVLRHLADSLGRAAGEEASQRAAILDAIESSNHEVTRLGAASTVAAVEIEGHTVRPYHVGDSMVLIVGQRGRVRLHTIPHSPVGYAVEAGVLDESEAIHHEDRHLVSNIVGSDRMRIEVGPAIDLRRRDTVLLATDGLWDNLHLVEVVDLIRTGPLERVIDHLADTVQQRMVEAPEGHPSKPDDLTVIVYRRG